MSAAKNLSGCTLNGERTGREWFVKEQIQFAEGISPGHFSVGYRVEDATGRSAFLKATDLRMAALGEAGFLQKLKDKVDAHTFERSLLDHVRGANMDRIVVALDYGNVEQVSNGAMYTVLFLVFEFAEGGDLRRHVNQNKSLDMISLLNVCHNLANGIRQLHSGDICHNDIKPGNLLVFDQDLQKLGDLGRATAPMFSAGHDNLICAGDPQYAAPEQLYGAGGDYFGSSTLDVRKAGDLFSLGSIVHFLLCKRMITPELLHRLDHVFWPAAFGGGWHDTYEAVLPHIRAAWGGMLTELEAQFDPADPLSPVVRELISATIALGDPDPRLRTGSPSPAGAGFSLENYISLFDRLRKKVLVSQRAR
jgi:serine/threonine protein kinase